MASTNSASCPKCNAPVTEPGSLCPACQEGADPEGLGELPQQLSATYEVVSLLGEGGMGRVFLARHRTLGREVAIKTILGLDEESRSRFVLEGQVLARLGHPNVVQVFDAGEAEGVPFLVGEYVDGENLHARLWRETRLVLPVALELILQILAGLAHAHERGVIHRDLKPENVLLTKSAVAKVADFGLAQIRVKTGRTKGRGPKQVGPVQGSPNYMSPEQARGEETGPATDIYATGVMLFEMFTGRLPYTGDSLEEILDAHIRQPIPNPRALQPDIPHVVAHLITKAMSKSPADRWPSAAAFGEAVKEARRDLTADPLRMSAAASALPAGRSRPRIFRRVILLALVVLAVAAATTDTWIRYLDPETAAKVRSFQATARQEWAKFAVKWQLPRLWE